MSLSSNRYYEVASGSCEKFQYSGCGGNGNRFHVREQCEELCMKEIPSHQLLETAATHQFVSVPAGLILDLKTSLEIILIRSNLMFEAQIPIWH